MKTKPTIFASLVALITVSTQVCFAQTGDSSHIKDVIYRHKLGCALTMDIFKPAKPNGIGVIAMVSGGWVSNHDNISPATAKAFTDRGETVFMVVHGSAPKFTLPEIMEDIHRAVRFVRFHAKEYGVDPNKLAATGGSAGGHLSLMMAAYGNDGNPDAKDPIDRVSSKIQCAAVFYPPTDFLNFGKDGVKAYEVPALRSYRPVFGISETATQDTIIQMGKSLSPMYGLTSATCPIFISHGDADTLVPIQQSQIVMAKLEELKVDHKLVIHPGKGHGWANLLDELPVFASWIEDHLGKK